MAKAQGPLHSDHARGSVSGCTYREFRGLPTVTRRPRPVRRTTMPLSNNRSILAYLARKWGDLPAASRALWLAYAQTHPVPNGFGGTFQLDGNQMFIKLNHTAIRLNGEAAEKQDPPTADSPATVDTVVASATAVAGELKLDWTHLGTPVIGDANEIQLAGPFQSAGRVSVTSRYRYVSRENGVQITSTETGLQSGAYYWARVRYVTADGQVTNWVSAQGKPL